MTIQRQRVSFTTAADGSASVSFPNSCHAAKLYAVLWTVGTGAAGIDFTLSTTGADGSGTVFAVANANSDAKYYPRVAANAVADGSALTWYDYPILDGRVVLTIAQGGDTKIGSMVILYEA